MSGLAVALDPPQQVTDKPKRELKVTRVVKAAIDAMVWQGMKREDAAQAAGMKDNSLYVALRRPEVKAYYLDQCEVLRTSGKARRIHRLEQMVEQDDNKAAVVNAVLALERLGDSQLNGNAGQSVTPGVVIQIIGNASVQSVPDTRLTQPEPLIIENDEGSV